MTDKTILFGDQIIMFEKLAKISIVLMLLVCFIGCGDVDKIPVPAPDNLAINNVLKRWREGYETEDVETYMSAYWPEGFRYLSDMGTDGDKTDDLIFDDIRDERDAAIYVFSQYQDIEIELSIPPEIAINKDGTQAEVRNHYRIQGFVTDGVSLNGMTNLSVMKKFALPIIFSLL